MKKQTPTAQKILLGIMGERIVAHYLRKEGHIVEESLNVFDSEKDMLVAGLPVEVKTQVPYMVEDSFAVLPHQLKKLKLCHKVYWISVPLLNREDDLAGAIFEMDTNDPSLKAHRAKRNDGTEVICFPRRQEAMKKIETIVDKGILEQLRKLSTSYL